jgi:6-pyruvoyl-tetrahydropterin synthase
VALLIVKHNIEVAHRLFELPGKCENIHGHSMWVELSLYGGISGRGLLAPEQGRELEFGDVKSHFRRYLDGNYDHRLLLNKDDIYAQGIWPMEEDQESIVDMTTKNKKYILPGLKIVPGDPTTEHLALWIAEWASDQYKTDVTVKVAETHTNAAQVDWTYVDPESK